MSFPETRPTLIVRLARGGDDKAWQHFLGDYWGSIVRFAARAGKPPFGQADDMAAETLLVLVRSKLLSRWQKSPTGKLRSLLCRVTLNVISNRQRIEQGRGVLWIPLARLLTSRPALHLQHFQLRSHNSFELLQDRLRCLAGCQVIGYSLLLGKP
jgi:hypothetical protein